MLRDLLSLLLALPMLLPPGVCVCNWLTPSRGACAEPQAAVDECQCCRHHQAADREMTGSPGTPGSDDHLPACPAGLGIGEWKLLPSLMAVDLAVMADACSHPVEQAGSIPELPETAFPADQPLYLILLTLRI